MIVDVGQAIEFLKRPVNVQRFVSEAYIAGELEKTFREVEELNLVCLPLTGSELKNQPVGEYDSDDLVVFQGNESEFLAIKDLVIRKGNVYTIRSCVDLEEIAGVKKFIAKKL